MDNGGWGGGGVLGWTHRSYQFEFHMYKPICPNLICTKYFNILNICNIIYNSQCINI